MINQAVFGLFNITFSNVLSMSYLAYLISAFVRRKQS